MGCNVNPPLALVLLLLACAKAHGYNMKHLQDSADCRPWTVAPREQCEYVTANRAACYPEGGVFQYIQWHYCSLGQW